MTPRKLQALMLVHYEIIKQTKGGSANPGKTTDGFIDTLPGW